MSSRSVTFTWTIGSSSATSWAIRYNPERPWEIVFFLAADPEHPYWRKAVRRPVELWLSRTGSKSGAPLTQEQKMHHLVAPGIAQLPAGSSVKPPGDGAGGGGGGPDGPPVAGGALRGGGTGGGGGGT